MMDEILKEVLIVQKECSKKIFNDKQTHADWFIDIVTVLGDTGDGFVRSSLVNAAAIILTALETYDRNNGFKFTHAH